MAALAPVMPRLPMTTRSNPSEAAASTISSEGSPERISIAEVTPVSEPIVATVSCSTSSPVFGWPTNSSVTDALRAFAST
jgi:hypothetical protein